MELPTERGAEPGSDHAETTETPETSTPGHQTPFQRPRLASSATLPLPRTQNASNPPKVAGALTLAQAKRLSQWCTRHQGLIKRCWQYKASPRSAIKAYCLDCCGEDLAAIVRCGDRCCPLWRYRPYQGSGRAAV